MKCVPSAMLSWHPCGREMGLMSAGWFHSVLKDKGDLQNILPIKLFGDCLVYLLTKVKSSMSSAAWRHCCAFGFLQLCRRHRSVVQLLGE